MLGSGGARAFPCPRATLPLPARWQTCARQGVCLYPPGGEGAPGAGRNMWRTGILLTQEMRILNPRSSGRQGRALASGQSRAAAGAAVAPTLTVPSPLFPLWKIGRGTTPIRLPYGTSTHHLQHPEPEERTFRAPACAPCGHVCLWSHGLRRPAPGTRPPCHHLRPAVSLPAALGLPGALCAQHHRRRPSGTRCRRRRGQDCQEGPAGTAGADGGGAVLRQPLPRGHAGSRRVAAQHRTAGLGTHHRADKAGGGNPEERLCLRE